MRAIMKPRNGWCAKSPAKAGEPSPYNATRRRGPTHKASSPGPKKPSARLVSPVTTHAAGVMGTEFKTQIIASTWLGRVGQAEDIARVDVFLGSDDAGWLTGEAIFANGGHK